MCQSKAEGGRRCYTHLAAAFGKAVADETKASGALSAVIAQQNAIRAACGGVLTGHPEEAAAFRALEVEVQRHSRRLVKARQKQEELRPSLMATDRGYQDALAEAESLDERAAAATDVYERRSLRTRAATLRHDAEAAHGGANTSSRQARSGGSVGESSDVSDMVAFMQDAGYTHFIIFDNERVERANIIPARDESELASILRTHSTKGAARLRRPDGTWPGPKPPLPVTDAARRPILVR